MRTRNGTGRDPDGDMDDWPKFLVVSRSWPPIVGGMEVVMYNLFRHVPAEACVVLRGDTSGADGRLVDAQMKLPHLEVCCDVPKWAMRLPAKQASLQVLRHLGLSRFVARGTQLVAEHNCTAVLGVFPFRSSVLAAQRIARQTEKPLFYYLHDIVEQSGFFGGVEARLLNPSLFRALNSARLVFTITEGLQHHYRAFLKKSPELLLQTAIVSERATQGDLSHASQIGRPPTVLYTGGITEFQRDSVQMVARWAHRQPEGSVRFLVCTFASPEELLAWGILGPNVEANRVSREEALRLQQSADVLLLPITFQLMNDEVRTLFPSKIIEYMNAGTPILVCAPEDTFIHRHVAGHGYAALLDKPDEAGLGSLLGRLLSDTSYRTALVQRAYECVRQHAWQQVLGVLKQSLQEATRVP
jgi:glycosyltransferase involved in cell wall biosynthesis